MYLYWVILKCSTIGGTHVLSPSSGQFQPVSYKAEISHSLDIGTLITDNFLSHLETPRAKLGGPHLLPTIAFPLARCLSCYWLVSNNLQGKNILTKHRWQ